MLLQTGQDYHIAVVNLGAAEPLDVARAAGILTLPLLGLRSGGQQQSGNHKKPSCHQSTYRKLKNQTAALAGIAAILTCLPARRNAFRITRAGGGPVRMKREMLRRATMLG
ncbi:hypothetical protein [Rhodopseudomonas sp.]|uniref:hypothetical protein n=1 Tax=Rhodopseudomonas sp. TaxID=1078 RepID=UPI0039C9ED18